MYSIELGTCLGPKKDMLYYIPDHESIATLLMADHQDLPFLVPFTTTKSPCMRKSPSPSHNLPPAVAPYALTPKCCSGLPS